MKINEIFQKLSEFFKTEDAEIGLKALDKAEKNCYLFNTFILIFSLIFLVLFIFIIRNNVYGKLDFFILGCFLVLLFLFACYEAGGLVLMSPGDESDITDKLYATSFLDSLIRYVFPGFVTNKFDTINNTVLSASKIFPVHYFYYSDDTIYGNVNDTQINIIEARLRYTPTFNSQGLRERSAMKLPAYLIIILACFASYLICAIKYQNYFTNFEIIRPLCIYGYPALVAAWALRSPFKGAIVDIQFNKKFSGHTIIFPKKALQPGLDKNYKKVKLEDVEFMKDYNVYSTDQIAARYILTTAFIRRFDDMRIAFNVKSLKCSFRNNRMLVAISTNKDMFNLMPEAFSGKTAKDKCLRTVREVSSIISIVEQLKLDQNIGM